MTKRTGLWIGVTVGVVGIGCVLVGFAANYDKPDDFWTVAMPGILTGVGTLALAAVTVILTLGAQRAEDEHSRRSQAESIAAWTPGYFYRTTSVPGGQPVRFPHAVAVHLTNTAKQPVYDMVILQSLVQGTPPGTEWIKGQIKAGNYGVFQVVNAVPPGEWSLELNYVGTPPPQGVVGIEFAFTDPLGQHWIRTATGTLTRIKETPGAHYGLTAPYPYGELIAGLTRDEPAI